MRGMTELSCALQRVSAILVYRTDQAAREAPVSDRCPVRRPAGGDPDFSLKGTPMRFSTISLSALMLAATATPAFADDAPTAPPSAFTINGTATVVSDYRFRGVSQTDKNVAVQGSITITHESGFYVSVWGSSVDSYVTASLAGHQEVDIIAGYSKTFSGTKIDGGVLYYVYPKSKFLPGDGSSSNFFEPYFDISHTFGPVTAKATINY